MSGIVLELQREALLPDIKVTDLLRKAYVVAKKLKLNDFEKWINSELNGYHTPLERRSLPKYRKVRGVLKAWNPYNGWIPALFNNDELANLISNQPVFQSIPELEDLISKSDGMLAMRLDESINNTLNRLVEFPTEYRLNISSSSVVNISESVKSIILDWTLKLEEVGIFGYDMTFSEEEKTIAQSSPIQNFTNNFYGEVSSPQLQQGTVDSFQE